MQVFAKVTKFGIARAMASALVLAVMASSTGLSLASFGPQKFTVTVDVFNGDPGLGQKVSGASVKMIADDGSNPDSGSAGITDGNGQFVFVVYSGSYTLRVNHPDFYQRDFHFLADLDTQFDASLIPLTDSNPTGGSTGNGCLPTPPRGQPMLNIWPVALTGADCTDYPLLMARNVTRNTNFVNNSTVAASANDVVRFHMYVHNGVLDFPENTAVNAMVKAVLPANVGSAVVTAEAWADNATHVLSAQKGGNMTISMGSTESLQLVSGSTKIYSRGPVLVGSGSDSVVTSGQALGNMRGCYDFLRIVTFDAKVIGEASKQGIDMEKTVRNVTQNQSAFVKSVTANPGDQVEFQLKVMVSGTVTNIKLVDTLPSRLLYVPNSLVVDGTPAGNLLSNIFLGTVTSTIKNVTFRATVADTAQFNVGTSSLVNTATMTSAVNNKTDTAEVVVNKAAPGTPNLTIAKTVRNISVDSNSAFVESVEVKKDEIAEFKIVVTNTGTAKALGVMIRDTLPAIVVPTYVSGSLKIDGQSSPANIYSANGSLGDFDPGMSKTLTFQVRGPQVSVITTAINSATASASNAGSVTDTAQIVILPPAAPPTGNPNLVLSKKAFNNTQNKDATTVTAKAGDVITYTLTVENTGTVSANGFVVTDNVADILQLSDFTNFGGGTYSAATTSINYPATNIAAGTKIERTFAVRIKNPVPTGTDYTMTNVYGNEVNVPVERPFTAPPTGTTTNLAIVLAVITAVGYFLYRRFKSGKFTLALIQ